MQSSERATPQHGPGYRLLLAALAVLLPIGLLLGAFEVGVRAVRGEWWRAPQLGARGLGLRLVNSTYPAEWDAELGYRPRPGARGTENVWHTEVTIDADGIRSNGASARPEGPPILVVGDSQTFGDEVGDAKTWPAQLEGMVGRPVINGGVFGYGLDQAVLRAERLLDRFPAKTLIVAVLPESILRCEFAYRYAWKPYFEVVNDELVLRNVPVPSADVPATEGPAWRRWFAWSHLADALFQRIDPDGWIVPDTIRVHRHGVDVARRLVDRVADLAAEREIQAMFVLQYIPGTPMPPKRGLVQRARTRGLPVVDVEQPFVRRLKQAGGVGALFRVHQRQDGSEFAGHSNAAGNRLTASLVAERLREIGDG